MNKLVAADLYTLEAYARERVAFRTRVLAHKQSRVVRLGHHMTFVFEDRLTIQYQVQEILRVERIFEPAGIAEELEAYNPLIPDGSNLKATMLVEYPDADERATKLVELHGVERRILLQVGQTAPIVAMADEDLPRSTETKTSAVHFLRFEFARPQLSAWRDGADVVMSVDHPAYGAREVLTSAARAALGADFA
ncbi:MAG: DUF3501 family protein [Rudaea sp.]